MSQQINILTPDQLAKMLLLPRRTIIESVTKQPGFPSSITGSRKPRWLEDAVLTFFKAKGQELTQNAQLP